MWRSGLPGTAAANGLPHDGIAVIDDTQSQYWSRSLTYRHTSPAYLHIGSRECHTPGVGWVT
ncbi:hypothetical protein Cci01nite_02440 [Catellatospora citrea]|uniref:Uncharacterized protein n=1 Tax=Catellatospora citrea TaxID=53366 RepID=A0A8J3NYB5_9ACTN|nr:hypothetical protein Cci01nite_02440 [Catellatospora citrea]